MKKLAVILFTSIGLAMTGCAGTAMSALQTENTTGTETPEAQASNTSDTGMPDGQRENAPDAEMSEAQAANASPAAASAAQPENSAGTVVSQTGPYGTISVSLPSGWSYEACSIDSDSLLYGKYGIHFYPEEADDGYIELAYVDFFGVCGTGLVEEEATVAGNSAWIGTYDNQAYWDFISFQGELDGIVAQTFSVEEWWDDHSDQIMDILNTISFDRNAKEGGDYVYHEESEATKIGLYFSMKKISSTGATLVFHQYDSEAPTGELEYGDDFVIERQKNGTWESVPVVVDGDYGFNAIAHIIPAGDSAEQELSWEWLYGALEPGEYRISKTVLDFRESGDYDRYPVYAYFFLN